MRRHGKWVGSSLSLSVWLSVWLSVSLVMATAGARVAWAADEAKVDAKPTAPALSDILTASGITATGFLDGTYSYVSTLPSGVTSFDTNTFSLNQASLTLAYTPAAGFGVLVNPVIGTEACDGCYAPGYGIGPGTGVAGSTSKINLLQGFIQFVGGKTTLYAGKFLTLAGAEVAAPTGNTNITRSLLFWYNEPVTHVGARVAYAASDKATFTAGVNNGWNIDGSTQKGGKTLEVGMTLTPSKVFTLAAAGYYGDADVASGVAGSPGMVGKRTLLDVVATWTATAKLTVIGSVDWDQQEKVGGGTSTASWYGVAGYLNYAINDTWRTSFRAEYLEDKDGAATGFGVKTKVDEGTLTFGYMPAKNFEFRFEGRYDTYKPASGSNNNVTQAWLQALYKF